MDSCEERAGFRFAGDDGAGVDGGVRGIEPEIGLPFGWILSVAVEAVFSEDWSDIAVEIRGRGSLGVSLVRGQECGEGNQQQGAGEVNSGGRADEAGHKHYRGKFGDERVRTGA